MYLQKSIIAAGLLISSTAMAASAVPTTSAFNFYGGVSAGPSVLQVERSTSTINRAGTLIKTRHTDSDLGAMAGVFAGVNFHFNKRLALALEANVNDSNTDASVDTSNPGGFRGQSVHFKQEMSWSYGISLLPSIAVNKSADASVFARLGYTRGDFDFKSTGTTTFDQGFNGKLDKSLNAYVLGLGFNILLSQHAGVRLEYDYNHYEGVKATSFDAFTNNTTTTRFEPQSSDVLLSAYYNV